MKPHALPLRIDRMPQARKAGPLLDPAEVVACALNGIPFKWWRTHKKEPPLSETSQPVVDVLNGLRLAGYKIVPMERADYERS